MWAQQVGWARNWKVVGDLVVPSLWASGTVATWRTRELQRWKTAAVFSG